MSGDVLSYPLISNLCHTQTKISLTYQYLATLLCQGRILKWSDIRRGVDADLQMVNPMAISLRPKPGLVIYLHVYAAFLFVTLIYCSP